MEHHDFMFFLQDKLNRFWQVNELGEVVCTSNPRPLQFSPDGWLDLTITNTRNLKYWAIDRTTSLPFKFVEDAAHILKYIFSRRGVEEDLYFTICEQTLDFEAAPQNNITGSNPFVTGTNLGQITGVPGQTYYIKLSVTGSGTDNVYGNIGASLIISRMAVDGNIIYSFVMPQSGVVSYNLLLTNDSTTATASLANVTASGSTTGNYGFWYKQKFKSLVDLTTYKHSGAYVTANTVDEGFAKHLKANENTVYSLPLNVPEAISVRKDGINLTVNQPYTGLVGYVIDQNAFTNEIAFPWSKQTAIGNAPYVSLFDESMEDASPDMFTYVSSSQNYIAKENDTAAFPIPITFDGKIKLQITALRTVRQFRLTFWQVSATATPTTGFIRTTLLSIPPINDTLVHEFVFAKTVTAQIGDKFFFTWSRNPGASPSDLSDYQFLDGTAMNITFSSRYQTTFEKHVRPQYIFSQIISLMSGGEYTAADCPYFGNTQYSDRVFTSGDGIRLIEGAVLKISWAIFWSFWNANDEVGIFERRNKTILFDRKKNLINFSKIIHLGEIVASPDITYMKEFAFNQLEIGYPDVKNENGITDGKNEFNTTSVWNLGTTKAPFTYQKISQIIASCYEQENVRIDNYLNPTTDNKNDNSIYVTHIKNILVGGSYNVNRDANPFLSGIDQQDSIYNWALSPMNCLLRSADYLHSALYLMEGRVLTFLNSDRNEKLAYNNAGISIIEALDVHVGDLASKFLKPVLMSIQTDAPVNLLELLDSDPLQIFDFTLNGDTYIGISNKNSINPKTYKIQTYELISTADNDLTKLEDYYGQ